MRSYRKENGLKQDALAYLLSVDQTTISRWKRGKDVPPLAMQKRLRDLFWSKEDSALEAVLRMVRSSPGRAAVVVPGTKIIHVSGSYAARFKTSPSEMKGRLMRHYVGDNFYEQYMVPVGDLGLYNGEVARVDYVAPVKLEDGTQGFSHSSVVPIFNAYGIYAASQSQYVSEAWPSMQVFRFDELVD